MKDMDHKTLLCDEDLFPSTPTPPKQAQRHSFACCSPNPNANLQNKVGRESFMDYNTCNAYLKQFEVSTNSGIEDEEVEREEMYMHYFGRRKDYNPCDAYIKRFEVSTNLRAAKYDTEDEEAKRDELHMDYFGGRKENYNPCNAYLKQFEVSTNLRAVRSTAVQYVTEDEEVERQELLMDYLRREKDYNPCDGYLKQLEVSSNLRTARSKAVQYAIDVCQRLGVDMTNVFNAANYLDRFISMNSCMKWEIWMVELLSITCVSLACKFYETCAPSLHDLQQMEDLDHTFKPTTIEEMELTVLKALDWRLSCVTAFTFANLMLGPAISRPMNDKATNLLLYSLLDPSIIKFKASIVATSALICATKGNDAEITMLNKIHVDEMDDVDNCTKVLETHLQVIESESGVKQWSPVSLILTKED